MSTKATFIAAVENLVPGTLPLSDANIGLAIDLAGRFHSRNKPRIIPEDVEGDGGFDYDITCLTNWEDGFSVIKQVEFPVDQDAMAPNFLQESQWTIYDKPTGKFLRLLEDKAEIGEWLRITYSTFHEISTDLSTIVSFDEQAVQALAAGFFCDMLSTYFAQNQDSIIHADSVDHTSKSRDYATRAKIYKKVYFDHLGIKEGETPPASVTHNQDKAGSWGDKITHPQRFR